jgi:tRNA splicing endonuclease
MVKLKLNEDYNNDFLTTTNGLIFYKKNNKLNKPESINDCDLNNIEVAVLFQQGILKLVDEGLRENKMESKVEVIKEDTPKNVINTSLKTEEVIREDSHDPLGEEGIEENN